MVLNNKILFRKKGGIPVETRYVMTVTVPDGGVFSIGATGVNFSLLDWGDNVTQTNVTGDAPQHTYTNAGTYTIYATGTVTRHYWLSALGRSYLVGIDNLIDQSSTNGYIMFYYTENLKYIRSSLFIGNSITEGGYMFSENNSLEEIDLPNFEGNNIINGNQMFRFNPKLKILRVKSLTLRSATSTNQTFNYLPVLEELNVDSLECGVTVDIRAMFGAIGFNSALGVSKLSLPKATFALAYYASLSFYYIDKCTEIDMPLCEGNAIYEAENMFYYSQQLNILNAPNMKLTSLGLSDGFFNATNLSVTSWSNLLIQMATVSHTNNFTFNGDGTKHNAAAVAAIATLEADGIQVIDGGLE